MDDQTLYTKVVQAFSQRFLRAPEIVVRAPGRVNLIGEHTDYNDGFVLPVAVDRAVWVAAAGQPEREAVIRALDVRNDEAIISLRGVPTSLGGWIDYPAGIAWVFMQEGKRPFGLQAVFSSTVPVGAGMSSSAAVEIAFAYTWQRLSGFRYERHELALLAQRAENQYVGVNCGIMDQMISACGQAGHAMLLDTRTLERSYFPLPAGMALLVADSLVRRSLASSEYNIRRAQCEEAVKRLSAVLPGIRALRDVTLADLERHAALLPPVILQRARHVVSENARVHAMAQALQRGDLEEAGALMREGHRSLRDDYEVSAPELDTLVEAANTVPGCYGARLTGAGFGGCTLALVAEEAVPDVQQHISAVYEERFGKTPAVYVVHPADGVSEISPSGPA